ncbi:AvrD family protein [Xenorhabdus khoisanae]|uniref:AvrD family protein n=1 Tax=Xenorhabdus khoisanae TaxID=880157 RepID=UPI00235A10A7|nr:AvrD family protein [Xenorhabdus khoisanae]MDC9615229.1 AvrD family protein [Xenorhabdus khoisanae]
MKKLVNADSYLGASESRFFGSGYKKVDYIIKEEEILSNEYKSTLTLVYPEDWSIKSKKKLNPHLSSIDVILISAYASGKLLNQFDHSYYKITSMIIRSSRVPVEKLINIPINIGLNHCDEGVTYLRGKVGNMQVQLKVERREFNDRLLNSIFSRWEFKDVTHEINDILLENKYKSKASVTKTAFGEIIDDIDYIDAFVSSLQIGQILLYELDGITREASNNLWMRSIKINEADVCNNQKVGTLEVTLENTCLIYKGNDKWRSADIVSSINNIQVRCSVAHQLSH